MDTDRQFLAVSAERCTAVVIPAAVGSDDGDEEKEAGISCPEHTLQGSSGSGTTPDPAHAPQLKKVGAGLTPSCV